MTLIIHKHINTLPLDVIRDSGTMGNKFINKNEQPLKSTQCTQIINCFLSLRFAYIRTLLHAKQHT